MSNQSYKFWILTLILAAISISQSVSPSVQAQQADSTAADTVQAAWELAKEAAAYNYASDVLQTSYPAPAVHNIGRAPRVDTFAVSGIYDQIAEKMELELQNQHNDTVEMMVDGTQAKGRTSADGQWEELGTVNEFFAPGGDPLGFLAGATNIKTLDPIAEPDSSLVTRHSSFAFDFSGHAFGRFVTDALTNEMIASGELMPNTELEVADIYRRMTGAGELTIDENGYPVHIRLDLDLGTQETGEQATAALDMYYSEFQQQTGNPTAVWFTPAGLGETLSQAAVTNPALPNQIAMFVAVTLFSIALALLVWHTWQTPAFYKAVAGSITVLMVAGPFLQVGSAHAYHGRLAPRLEREETQERTAEETTAEMVRNYNEEQLWNPQQNPLLGEKDSNAAPEITVELDSLLVTRHSSLSTATTVTSTVDTDNDGVSDTIEEQLELCSGPSGSYCTGVTDSTDSDGDGLSDGEEVNQLGTFGDRVDSDNDGISDYLEVKGFAYNGTQWYLDPNQQDTNQDGLPDGAECSVWLPAASNYNTSAICPDTNGNGTPDIFDHDNDNDGVPDGQDLSPQLASSSATPFDRNNPFKLKIDNLEVGKPVLVGLQLRPTNAENLYHMGDVVDWPSPDLTGQIQRRFSTTFATSTNTAIRASSGNFNSGYGDMRITPLLEIQMPVSATHYANLPVKSGLAADRPNGYTTTQWLDDTKTTPYGLSIFDSSNNGTISAFLPLHADTDASGGGRVAFSAQMIYEPSQGTAGVADWNAAHEYRLVWLVEMITEECTDPANNATCTEKMSVVHIYDDEWTLTGMTIREEHGTNVAVMYENPATDSDRTMENSLWEASFNLGNSFMRARDCATMTGGVCNSNNARDVKFSDISTFVSTYDSALEPITTETFSYPHYGFVSHIMMTETKRILTTHFQTYAGQMNPTLLFAQEQDMRAYNLDDMAFAGNQVTADMTTTNAPRQIVGGLSWGPYSYNTTTAEWESANLIEYVSGLESRLQTLAYFQPTSTALADQYEAMGKIRWVQTYYLSLAKGLNSILEVGGDPVWGQSNFYPESSYQAEIPGATFTGAVFLAYYTFEGVAASFKNVANGGRFVKSFLQEMGRAYGSMATGQLGNVNNWVNLTRVQKVFVTVSNATMGVTALAAIAGIAILAAAWATGNTQLQTVAVLMLNAATVVVSTSVIISNTIFLASLRKLSASGSTAKLIQLSQKGPVKAITGLGTILQFAAIWGGFIWAVRDVSPNTIQFDIHLASAIAQTIVAVLILVIAALVYAVFLLLALAAPGIGSIVVMAIYLIDALVYLITYFLSAVFGIGKPTSVLQELTTAIADALYDVDIIIPNLSPTNRLDFYPHISFFDERLGFTVGNSITMTMDVTNTAAYNGKYSFDVANNAAFRYALERSDAPVPATHSGLTAGSMDAQWQNLGNNQMRYTTTSTITIPFSDLGYGRDRNLDSQLYLVEGMAIQYSGCWQVVPEICKLETINDSMPLNVGASQVFDILPATISEFRTMSWIGNGNSVGQTSLTAPVAPTDFDNDRVHVSIDPDDTKWDADGDGLGDYFERTKGTNPNLFDTDGDGLNDAEEFREGTDPKKADTDNDGLSDYIEVTEGWLIAYDGGTTRIWSNPIVADYDNDKLSDLEEYMFGFNPYIHTDPSLVDNLIEFDAFDVVESNAPVLYLPFDETTTTGAFADLSGNSLEVTCNQAAGFCPIPGVDGRFGNAIQLDGTNDFVKVAHDASFNFDTNDDFTVAMWVKPDNTQPTAGPSLFEMWADGQATYPFVMRYNQATGTVYGARYDGANNPSAVGTAVINDGEFHHIALTRLDGTLYLYVDGVLDGSIADSTTAATANTSPLFIGNRDTAYHFAGAIDEYVVYPTGMTAAQVQQVQGGSYNLNDLVFSPGDPFTYQTTVTNTNSARNAEGVLIANSTYITPSLSNPTHLLEFEIDPNRTSWDGDNWETYGGRLTCSDTATCPTVDLGKATFDGVDDRFDIAQIDPEFPIGNLGIQFDVKLDRAPVNGEKMYIIDSQAASVSDGTYAEYVDVYFTYHDGVTAKLVIERIELEAIGYNPAVVTSYNSVPVGTEITVDFRYFDTDRSLYIYNGATLLQQVNFSNFSDLRVGPGAVGNSVLNDGQLDGYLSSLRIYTEEIFTDDSGLVQREFRDRLYTDFNYYEELLYSTPTASELGQSLMDCTGAACPTFERNGGRYGGGAVFSSVPTETIKMTDVDLSGDFTIAGWVNPQVSGGFLANSYASDADYYAGGQHFIITASPTAIGANGVGSSGAYILSGVPTSGWNHFAFVRTETGLALYINGSLAQDTTATTLELSKQTMRLGRLVESVGFNGSVDDFAVFDYALDNTQVALLAAGKYPAVEIDSAYVDFAVPAGTTVSPSGTGRIEADAPASNHRFDQIADVAYDTTLLPYTAADTIVASSGSGYAFDELPGHIGAFELNSVTPTSGAYFACTTATDCPTTGVPGVDRRAVYFDGNDDVITYINQVNPLSPINGLSMWVKAERGTLFSGYVAGAQFTRSTSFHLDVDGFSASTDGGCNFDVPYSMPLNEWAHIAIAITDSDKTARYYVNGQLAASQTITYSYPCQNSSGIKYIGSNVNGDHHFKGYIDDLRFYNAALANPATQSTDVQNLYQKSVPLLRFGFDEEGHEGVFTDSSGRDRIGTPTALTQVVSGTSVTVQNPPLGTDGKIGNIAAFNGQGVITVEDPNNDIGNLTNDLTMMAWIKPTNMAGETSWRTIVSSRLATTTNGFFFGTVGTKLTLLGYGAHTIVSTADINPDLWQHVAVTMDGSRNVTFYINGAVAGSGTLAGDLLANTDDDLNIGGRVDAGVVKVPFQGGIDELVIYKRNLSGSEVTREFLTGLRWYRDRGSQILTVDRDNPTVNLITSQTYFTNTFTMLAVETSDPTSRVTLLDFGIKGPSDSAFSWQGASPCADGALGRVWCPSFNPATMGGEGRYEVQFRAVDAVGNETTSPISYLYIDTTAPTATSNHSGEWGTLTAINGRSNSWTVPLAGTISDGTINGGFAGSGVVSSTVMVALRGSDGRFLSGNRQLATVSGSNWSLDFNILSELPSGTYTVSLQAQDRVGNLTDLANIGTLKLDGVAPTAAVDNSLSPQIVSGTVTTPVQGTVDDASGRGVESVEVNLSRRDNSSAPAIATIGTWQSASLSGANWSYSLPTGIEGFFELDLRATDNDGNTAEKGTQWRGVIDTVPPVINGSVRHIWDRNVPKTSIYLVISDFALDTTTVSHPCGAGDVVTTTYSAPSYPNDGLTYQSQIGCILDGHLSTGQNVGVCDFVGNCTNQSMTPIDVHALTITANNDSGSLNWSTPNSCAYHAHGSASPYFVASGATFIQPGVPNPYTINNLSGLGQSYYYLIEAQGCTGVGSSNTVGVFNFSLTPGQ